MTLGGDGVRNSILNTYGFMLSAMIGLAATQAAAAQYAITHLGTLGGTVSGARGMNNSVKWSDGLTSPAAR